MTTIDGTRAPGTIPADGPTLDRVDELSRFLGRSPAEIVALAVVAFAPPVETAAPGGTRGQGEAQPPAPTAVAERTARWLENAHRGAVQAAAVAKADPAAIATTLPPACPDCGERSIHEECP